MSGLIRKITFTRGNIVFVFMNDQRLSNGMKIGRMREFTEGSSYGVEIYVENTDAEVLLWQRVMSSDLIIEFDYEKILRD